MKDRDITNIILIDDNLPEFVKYGCRFVLASSMSDFNNPFLSKTYDFDKGFYRGEFEFLDPLTNVLKVGTPEEYGRKRLAANLSKYESRGRVILDLGAGTLNIYRQLPAICRQSLLYFVNCDISGPWSVDGESTMELGARRAGLDSSAENVINVQYDFNASLNWPFRENVFDDIVSCMAIHHVRPENKAKVLESIFRSLKGGGKLTIVDFFLKQDGGAKVTDAGLRGPEECSGYGQSFSDFLSLCQEVGFSMDEFCKNIILNRSFPTQSDLGIAIDNISKTLQINKAIWFTVLSKRR